jgi:hypothetical protein
MENPYTPDPKRLKQQTAQVQEQQLIALQDDSTKPPPTIATPSWMSIIGSPFLGQPSSSYKTFDHRPGRFTFSPMFWLIIFGLGCMAFVVYQLFFSSPA